MKRVILSAALAAAIAAPVAIAAEMTPMEKAVKARQSVFQVYSFNIGQLAAMAKGEKEYDAELAQNSADNLVKAATMKNGAMWPAGSDNTGEMKGKTRAKPEIWANYPKVVEKFEALQAAATNMAAAAGTLDGVKGAIGDLGGACKSCHDDFRAKDF